VRVRDTAGSTLVELLVGTAITLAATGAALALARPAHAVLRSQLDYMDARQRVRVATESLIRDVTIGGSALPSGSTPFAVYAGPRGETGLTVRYGDSLTGVVTSHSYYVLLTAAASGPELRRWNGTTDAPVADGIEGVAFECADSLGAPIGCASWDVRNVRISLTARTDAGPLHVSINVAPRCLQDPA
jgi:hypothetical protein